MSMFSEKFEEWNYGLQDLWRYRVKGVKKISLAVIGGPASGKSYMITDIIQALAKMGIRNYSLTQRGIGIKGFPSFEPDNLNEDGSMRGTPLYACRRENHYGACANIVSHKEFDIDFLNIPGETFNDVKVVNLYFELCEKLNGREGNKLFKMVTWRSATGDEQYVIEPRNPEISQRIAEAKKDNDMYVDPDARRENFLGWSEIFSELEQNGYKEVSGSTKVSGKYILNNLLKLNVDSVMESIGEVCKTFNLNGLRSKADFEQISRQFYFLHYSQNATDIVLCDKILVPKNYKEEDEPIPFSTICNTIQNFYSQKGIHPHIYLSFRGIDFLLHGSEDMYRRLGDHLANNNEKRVNAQYSLFSYLLWHHVKNNVEIETEEGFEKAIGFQINNVDVETLTEKFLNLDFSSMAKVADGGTVQSIIRTHIGTTGQGFCKLLSYAYPTLDLNHQESSLDGIIPHVYFSATPITSQFKIYTNDPKENKRFIKEDEHGDARRFDLVGDHMCFGSYQLCMDILMQNKVFSQFEYGDLLDRCMQS